MVIKPKKLLGLKFTDFQEKVSSGKEIHLQRARLIPFYKPGDEMALTSIFLFIKACCSLQEKYL